ncbi:hypothetical protein SUDANB6_02148 [Streptomyces sp. enrichment culture]
MASIVSRLGKAAPVNAACGVLREIFFFASWLKAAYMSLNEGRPAHKWRA